MIHLTNCDDLISNHCKNGDKIESGHMMTGFMTSMTYKQNSRLSCGNRSRIICTTRVSSVELQHVNHYTRMAFLRSVCSFSPKHVLLFKDCYFICGTKYVKLLTSYLILHSVSKFPFFKILILNFVAQVTFLSLISQIYCHLDSCYSSSSIHS